jgi:bacteriocin-like protein
MNDGMQKEIECGELSDAELNNVTGGDSSFNFGGFTFTVLHGEDGTTAGKVTTPGGKNIYYT